MTVLSASRGVIDTPLGSVERIRIRVLANDSMRVPKGYVALWDSQIPRGVQFVKGHTVFLHDGNAAFELKEDLPAVPFDVTVPEWTMYYVPAPYSGFEPSAYGRCLQLRMHLWHAKLSVRPDPNGARAHVLPVRVSVSNSESDPAAVRATPAGDLTVSDTSDRGEECGPTRVPAAFPYRGSGKATLDVNLPRGRNTLRIGYAGDAYFGPTQRANLSVGHPDQGWTGACPAHWVRLAPQRYVPPLSGSDIPMFNYGFPPTGLDRTNEICCYGDYSRAALDNPDVGRLVVQLDWSYVEPNAGQFDFGPADAEVRAAISRGKKVALLLRFETGLELAGTSNSCEWSYGHGAFLPRWVGNALGSGDSFCSHGTGWVIPKYWSAKFITLWETYVRDVAAHFGYDCSEKRNRSQAICVNTGDEYRPSDVAYVRAAVGLGDEGIAITGPNSTPKPGDLRVLLKRWKYNPQLWEAWQEDMLSFYKRAFQYSPWVLYTINRQITGLAREQLHGMPAYAVKDVNKRCGDPVPEVPGFQPRRIACTGKPIEVDVAEWAINHGFGLSQNSLQASWIWTGPQNADPPPGHLTTILNYALRHSPHPFIELQTLEALSTWCPAVPTGLSPCWPVHRTLDHFVNDDLVNAEDDLTFARRYGITAIEWYDADCARGSGWCKAALRAGPPTDDLTNSQLRPVINLWRQLQAIRGRDQIPTVVTVTPVTSSAQPGKRLGVTIRVEAPGIAGFNPPGRVWLSNDLTGQHLTKAPVEIPPSGKVTIDVRVPNIKGHINLSACYFQELSCGSSLKAQRNSATLWRDSTSVNVPIAVRR